MIFVEKANGVNLLKKFDYLIFIPVLMMSIIGIIVLSSATRIMKNNINGDGMIIKQIIALVIGIVICLVLNIFDYKDFKLVGGIVYVINIVLLILVLVIGIGHSQVGMSGWFYFKGISFQPSELVKVSYVIFVSKFLYNIKQGDEIKKNVLKFVVYSILPLCLILAQPDAGTAMVLIFIIAIMVFISGIPYKYILACVLAFIISMPILWFKVLDEYQKNRLISFISPESFPTTIGYNVIRSKLAIGSGQIYGQGLYKGVLIQTATGVPEKHTDFIFSVIGQELGFVGCITFLILVFTVLFRCIYVAKYSRDKFGSYVIIGLTAMFAFHFFENIGMSIGISPVTGIPLPFVSNGGSSLITNYIAIGIILSVSRRRESRPLIIK